MMLDDRSGINFGNKTFIKNDSFTTTNVTTISAVASSKSSEFKFLAREMRFLNGDSTSDSF